jgi:hypothetical protein
MDYLIEARKFVQRAHNAVYPEVIETELELAEWFLSQAIRERDDTPSLEPRNSRPAGVVNAGR